MDFYIISSFLNGIVAILFGWLIFSKNWKNVTNWTFFLMNISVAIWNLAYCVWFSRTDPVSALYWSKMLNLGATLIPIFYLHWTLSIVNLVKEKKNILIFGYLFTLFCSVLSFSDFYIKSVVQVGHFLFWPQAGPLYSLFLIFGYYFLTIYGMYQLFKARKWASGEKRHQINYVILGSLLGFGGGATNFPFMYGFNIVEPIGQPLVIFYIIIFALATLRYHLFEIKIILVEFFVGIMSLALAFLFLFSPTGILKLISGSVFFLFVIFGIYFIRIIHREIAGKEEAERISRLKTEFISIVSHQLRTPLAAIRGYADMIIKGDYGIMPDGLKSPINYIHDTSVSMIKTVNNLLSISRLERGKIELKIQEEDVLKLICDCIKDVKLAAKEKKLYLKYNKPKSEYPLIKMDAEKIKHALTNILNNAILYTLEGGITIKVSKNKVFVTIEIKDTGVGIEKDEIEKVFLSFSRGERGRELYTQGTGLGLYVAKSFVEMHKGKIICESEGRNKGTTFYIQIPIISQIPLRQDFNLPTKKS